MYIEERILPLCQCIVNKDQRDLTCSEYIIRLNRTIEIVYACWKDPTFFTIFPCSYRKWIFYIKKKIQSAFFLIPWYFILFGCPINLTKLSLYFINLWFFFRIVKMESSKSNNKEDYECKSFSIVCTWKCNFYVYKTPLIKPF